MSKKGFTFKASGDHLCYDIKIHLEEDSSLEEVLHAFENFLRSSGFYINMDDYITIEEGIEIDFTPEPDDLLTEKGLDKLFKDIDKTISKTSNVVSMYKKSDKGEKDENQ